MYHITLFLGPAPQFDNAVPMGPEGGIITGRLVINGLQMVTDPGILEFEITAGEVPGAISAIKGKLHFHVICILSILLALFFS